MFDADGTLWDDDAGEAFFHWQIAHSGLKGLPTDPWAHYQNWKLRDPHGAYAWLAQISAGHELSTVRQWAKTCFESHRPWPVFKSIKELVRRLHAADFEIFVVTASVKWSVEPAALALLGIPFSNVLGIETESKKNATGELVVTDQVKLPITYRQGKADALLKASDGRRPLLAAGNTLGDISLLESSTDLKLMIQSQSPTSSENRKLAAEELRLREHGVPLGWRLHAFRN